MSSVRTPADAAPDAPGDDATDGRASAPPRRAAGPPAARLAIIADAVQIVAWLSIAAGLIHAIAMVDHFSHYWLYGVFFLILTYGQVLWGVRVLRKAPTDRSLRISAFANLAIVAVWLVSRTSGIPFGRFAWQPEAVGVMDVAATLDQLMLAAYVAAILRPQLRAVRGYRALLGAHRIRIGMALCSASFFAALLGSHHHH